MILIFLGSHFAKKKSVFNFIKLFMLLYTNEKIMFASPMIDIGLGEVDDRPGW